MMQRAWWERELLRDALSHCENPPRTLEMRVHVIIPTAFSVSLDRRGLHELRVDIKRKKGMGRARGLLVCARCGNRLRGRSVGRYQVGIRVAAWSYTVEGKVNFSSKKMQLGGKVNFSSKKSSPPSKATQDLVNGEICLLCPLCRTVVWMYLMHCDMLDLKDLFGGVRALCAGFACNIFDLLGRVSLIEVFAEANKPENRPYFFRRGPESNGRWICERCGDRPSGTNKRRRPCASCQCVYLCNKKACKEAHLRLCKRLSKAIVYTEDAFDAPNV